MFYASTLRNKRKKKIYSSIDSSGVQHKKPNLSLSFKAIEDYLLPRYFMLATIYSLNRSSRGERKTINVVVEKQREKEKLESKFIKAF